jgi:ribosomal protein S18 acetylase RimI-like enzyme
MLPSLYCGCDLNNAPFCTTAASGKLVGASLHGIFGYLLFNIFNWPVILTNAFAGSRRANREGMAARIKEGFYLKQNTNEGLVMIRDALPKDAKSIANVHVSSWQHAYVNLMPADFLASLTATLPKRAAHWAHAIESKEADVLVSEVDGNVIGWISVGPCRDEDKPAAASGEVMAIYVLAEYWGKGIGAELWTSGLKRLFDQGYKDITLWVLSANERAVRFYQGLGGREEPGSRRTLVRGGVSLDEVRYVWGS